MSQPSSLSAFGTCAGYCAWPWRLVGLAAPYSSPACKSGSLRQSDSAISTCHDHMIIMSVSPCNCCGRSLSNSLIWVTLCTARKQSVATRTACPHGLLLLINRMTAYYSAVDALLSCHYETVINSLLLLDCKAGHPTPEKACQVQQKLA